MSKLDINKELGDLIYRFKVLKKAIAEEETLAKSKSNLSPAQQRAAEIAASLRDFVPNKERQLAKAKELEEQQKAQALANQLRKTGILGAFPPAPRQPTNEEMAMMSGAPTQEQLEKQEAGWGTGVFNNWLQEANKPISQRFKNEEEELAYWNSIKINSNGGEGGY